MQSKLIIAALTGGFLLAVFFAGHFHGKQACTENQTKQVVKEAKDEAQRFADRPKSDCDFINRVRNWAAVTAKGEGQPVQRFPVCASK